MLMFFDNFNFLEHHFFVGQCITNWWSFIHENGCIICKMAELLHDVVSSLVFEILLDHCFTCTCPAQEVHFEHLHVQLDS